MKPEDDVDVRRNEEWTRFIILCAPRTGSNLLSGLLDSHPECFVAGELFNPRLIDTDQMPIVGDALALTRDALLDLRRANPVSFVHRFFDALPRERCRAAGFKLIYHHADLQPAVRDDLVNQRDIRVIHLKRKNLLRLFLSERRAQLTDVWAQSVDTRVDPLPSVNLPFLDAAKQFAYLEKKQIEYQERFKDHRVLDLTYEDLAADPQGVISHALAFLGLGPPAAPAEIRFRKMSTDSLRDAIANYDDLKANFYRWASFFEE